MNFDFTEDQHEIKRTARDLLGKRSPFEKVREHAEAGTTDDALWKELAELGWPGIAIAEEHGGQGLGVVELAILCEELGYAVAATPFLGDGDRRLAIQAAAPTSSARGGCRARLRRGDRRVGTRQLCPDAAGAAVLVLVDGDEARARSRGRRRRAGRGDRPDPPLRHGPRRWRAAGGAGRRRPRARGRGGARRRCASARST